MSSSFSVVTFTSFSKLQDSEKRNQDLQEEIERLKRETEELRLSKGKYSHFSYCGCLATLFVLIYSILYYTKLSSFYFRRKAPGFTEFFPRLSQCSNFCCGTF